MTHPRERLRLTVYRHFARTGQAPTTAELVDQTGTDAADVAAGLFELSVAHHVALDADGRITLARPFSAVPTGSSAMGRDTLWWGGSALDAFALPHLLPEQAPVLVATRCPHCDAVLALDVGPEVPPAGEAVAHLGVPAAQMADDPVRTCTAERLFCSPNHVDGWLAATGHPRGEVLDLVTLWRLAAAAYQGRLDYGYVPPGPVETADHYRSVGLSGSFWGV